MKRLISLDVLRGITVFGMILVNNGVGHQQFSTLQHAEWNGLTPCDLVFPFFLFMVGVSIYLSLKKFNFTPTPKLVGKILRRTAILFLMGMLLHAWDMMIWSEPDILANIRVWSVLGRIALCYGIVSLLMLWVGYRHLWKIVLGLLILYSAILILGNGYAQDDTNLACIIDRALCGEAHLYHKSPVDPEGLLGTISSVAHTIIGVMVGKAISEKKSVKERIFGVLLIASLIGVAGYLLSYGFPLNKRIWSPSYVLVTCSLAASMLGLLTYVIDEKGHSKCFTFFRAFGVNAFFMYVLSEALASIMWYFNVPGTVFDSVNSLINCPEWSSAIYALLFDASLGLIALLMWKMKWMVKI